MRRDSAAFSTCGTYRYELRRYLGEGAPLVICGLNPSSADAETDDPTLRRDIGFAQRWKCGLVVKVNAYALIETDVAKMKRQRAAGRDVIGPENERWLRRAIRLARDHNGIFLAAWGAHIEPDRQHAIAVRLAAAKVTARCLGMNKNGTPAHELYVPYDRALRDWRPQL